MEDLRYPIGPFKLDGPITEEQRQTAIDQIAAAPALVRQAVAGLSEEQLETPYRPGGWTIRQVVHHLPDSHMNSYVRFRLALTEDEPAIRTYQEDLWAQLSDAKTAPVELSLALLEALHGRWVLLLRSLSPKDFARTLNHPEQGQVTLERNACIYAWHGRHHVAHIKSVREQMGWDQVQESALKSGG